MSSAILLLVQAAASPTAPASAPAPMISVPPTPAVERYRADVRIVGGHGLLWSGSLKVGGGITHVFFRANQPDHACAAPDGSYRADGSGWTLGLLTAGRARGRAGAGRLCGLDPARSRRLRARRRALRQSHRRYASAARQVDCAARRRRSGREASPPLRVDPLTRTPDGTEPGSWPMRRIPCRTGRLFDPAGTLLRRAPARG